ncbi:SDR family NAD(P)-dependent oxidoreductase [Frankia sp. AvcI1]|uniref:SDR family NAD(P)-dependent oxidoreductase n=2 Tax=Frankia sp. AvcI1 TaxID=573496 RepID=UPI0021179A94|nr:SDR family oxidoreductase [Frankia sp. AvcI1]
MNDRATALVTGGSRGIGRGIAERLAAAGYTVVIAARRSQPLEETAAQLRAAGGDVHGGAGDMAQESDVEALARFQLEISPRLELLVLAAGVGTAGPFAEYPLRRLDVQVAVNLRAPFLLVQRLLPALRAAADAQRSRGARVVAIASITGVAAEPDLAAYGATKAALISLCESLTVSEGKRGVNATAISPGYVDTDMTEWVRGRIPRDEMIKVDDVAELVMGLSRMSRYAAVPNVVLTRPGVQLWRA